VDVLVNNAANFIAGFFEELTQEEIMQQLNTSLKKITIRKKASVYKAAGFLLPGQ